MSVVTFKPRSAGEFLVKRPLEVELVKGAVRYVKGQVDAQPVDYGGGSIFLSFVDDRHELCVVPCVRNASGEWVAVGLLQRASAWSIDRGPKRLEPDFELTPAMREAIAAAAALDAPSPNRRTFR